MMWYQETKWEKLCNFVCDAIDLFQYLSDIFLTFVLCAGATMGAILFWTNAKDTFGIFFAITLSLLSIVLFSMFLMSIEQ